MALDVSCRDPTEVMLKITSNTCQTLTTTGIAVGPAGLAGGGTFAATQAGCPVEGTVGTIGIVPSGSRDDNIGIEVIGGLGKDPATCTRGDPKCIVARRSLRYVPHTELTLPIALEAACAGVACDDPSTTCLSGVCVRSVASCSSGVCGLEAPPGNGGLADAGPQLEGGAIADGSVDGSVPHGDAGGVVTVIASSQASPVGIYVDATDIYWANATTPTGSIMRCAIDGCAAPEIVAAGQLGPFEITGDAANVYWTNFVGAGSQVVRAGKSGGVEVLAANLDSAFAVAVAGNLVYWTRNLPAGAVQQCLATACDQPKTLASGQNGAGGVAVDATTLYWTNVFAGEVRKCTLTACSNSIVVVASGLGYPELIALDATDMYWTNYTGGTVMKCAKTGCGGSPTIIASGLNAPRGIALDDANVYITTLATNGLVLKCAKTGCGGSPEVLADQQRTPFSVAVDDKSVYWTSKGDGTIKKRPK